MEEVAGRVSNCVGMRRCMTKSFEPDATGPSPCESGHPHTLLCIAWKAYV